MALRPFTFQSFTHERPFLTSNKFVLIQNPMDSDPFIQLKANGKQVHLQKDMDLWSLERGLKEAGEAQ